MMCLPSKPAASKINSHDTAMLAPKYAATVAPESPRRTFRQLARPVTKLPLELTNIIGNACTKLETLTRFKQHY